MVRRGYLVLALLVLLGLLVAGCANRGTGQQPTGQRPTATATPAPPVSLKPDGPPGPPVREYRFAVIDAATDGNLFWCRAPDAGCSPQHPWWMTWRDQQDGSLVQFRFLPPGFVAEQWLAEAVVLVSQYPEGRQLLREGGEHGVFIMAAPASLIPGGAHADYGHFAPQAARIRFNERHRKVSTFLLADILVHELTHLHDAYAGVGEGDCFGNALQGERRFLRWLSDWMGGLPSREVVARELSAEDNEVFNSTLFRLEGTPRSLNDFARKVHHTTCPW